MNSDEAAITADRKPLGLSACAIKYIAVIAMLIDHIAWCFVNTYTAAGEIMHVIGRITAPVMTYFLVEGFHHTRSVNRYLLRLGIFAAVSYIPFVFMEFGTLPIVIENGSISVNPLQGVIYTFFLTVLSLKVRHSKTLHPFAKIAEIVGLCILSIIGDWFCFPIVWAMLFDKYRGSFKKQAIAFAVSSVIMVTMMTVCFGGGIGDLFQYGVLLALIPIWLYNGERGKVFGKADKWFFYIFYPLHMLILGFLKFYVLM